MDLDLSCSWLGGLVLSDQQAPCMDAAETFLLKQLFRNSSLTEATASVSFLH